MNPQDPQHPGYQPANPYNPNQPPQQQTGQPAYGPAPNVMPPEYVPPVAEDMPEREYQLDPEIQARHDNSVSRYAELHLSPAEYVIAAVPRHPIGLLSIWAIAIVVILLTFLLVPLYAVNQSGLASMFGISANSLPSAGLVLLPLLVLDIFFVIGAMIATKVYNGNKFYVTNESVIQFIQTSLFSSNQQTVNLRNIEDVSFRQQGVIAHIFNYGSIRLSTEGDETTYRFNYVANPKDITNEMVDAIEHAMGLSSRWRKNLGTPPNIGED